MKTFNQFITESAKILQFPNKNKEHEEKKFSGNNTNHFKKWAKENLKSNDGSSVTETEAYDHYCHHSNAHKIEPLSLPDFSKHLNDHGIMKQRIAGRIRRIGVSLK